VFACVRVCVCARLTNEARLQRWGMMYMKIRRGHCRDGSVMKKPEKRNDANLPRSCSESVWTGSGSQQRTRSVTSESVSAMRASRTKTKSDCHNGHDRLIHDHLYTPGADEEQHSDERVAEEGAHGLSYVLEGPERHAVDDQHRAELGRVEVGNAVGPHTEGCQRKQDHERNLPTKDGIYVSVDHIY
jgi:hypothetical protein